MIRTIFSVSAIALMTAIPAYAQYGAPAPAPAPLPEAAPAPDAAPAPADATAAPPPAAAETMPPAAAPMTPEAAQTPADWAKFDKGNKGYLDALEFGNWLMAKQGNDMTAQVEKTKASKQSNLPAVKVLNATGSAFLKADKNGDRHITPDELATAVAG